MSTLPVLRSRRETLTHLECDDGSRSEAAGPQEQDVRTLRSAKDTQLHALLDQSLAADNSSLHSPEHSFKSGDKVLNYGCVSREFIRVDVQGRTVNTEFYFSVLTGVGFTTFAERRSSCLYYKTQNLLISLCVGRQVKFKWTGWWEDGWQ